MQTMQNTAKQNYPSLVAFCNTWPGNKVGLFCNTRAYMGRQLSKVRTPGNRLRGYNQQTTVWQRTTNGQQTTQQRTISLQQFNQWKEISRVRPVNNRQLINDLSMTVQPHTTSNHELLCYKLQYKDKNRWESSDQNQKTWKTNAKFTEILGKSWISLQFDTSEHFSRKMVNFRETMKARKSQITG